MTTSSATTRGIRVDAFPDYLPERSDPAAGRYFFRYRIVIHNLGEETVQLLARTWKITDGDGHVELVRGPGVVGEQPVLAPGDRHEYTSFCPLTTSVGVMEGSYLMQTADGGGTFEARIAPFTLAADGAVN